MGERECAMEGMAVGMKISIIIPVYNTSEYLRQCLQSLMDQEFPDAEFICINDGSTDGSIEIIREFTEKDARFFLIDKRNTGYGKTMNLGIQKARGTYVGILESDDFAQPDMLGKLWNVVEQYHPDIVKGNFNECDRHEVCRIMQNLDAVPYNQIISAREQMQIFRIHPSIWTSLYRKTFLEENDITFLETPGASFQDISFSFKALHSADTIVCIPDAVMNYRMENFSSSIYNPEKNFCVCDELNEMKRFLNNRRALGKISEEWFGQSECVIDWLLYINYVWNYTRLAPAFKYAFLLRMHDEFADFSEKTFESGLWTEDDLNIVRSVVNEMNIYYKTTLGKQEDPRLSFFPLLNYDKKFPQRAFLGFIRDYDRISIYGAGKVGKRVFAFLKAQGLSEKVQNFVVSDLAETEIIEGKPVVCVNTLSKTALKENLFLVSVTEKLHFEILKALDRYEAENIILMNEILREVLG